MIKLGKTKTNLVLVTAETAKCILEPGRGWNVEVPKTAEQVNR